MLRFFKISLVLLALVVLGASESAADRILLTTRADAQLSGQLFLDGDIVAYDLATQSTRTILSESTFDGGTNLDAIHRLDDGSMLLSAAANLRINGVRYSKGDIVLYDPLTDTASLFLDGSDHFGNRADIDAIAIATDGVLLISMAGTIQIGGVSYTDGDVIAYDPVTRTASEYFDEGLFGSNADINGLAIKANGHLLLSTDRAATLAGLGFEDYDVVEYDPINKSATLFFDGSAIVPSPGTDSDIWGISLPEPRAGAFVLLALAAIAARRRVDRTRR
jgi:sugar lactone lactonase YvrE